MAHRLGGLTRRWRFDRMATVCHPDSGALTATFGPVAAYYRSGSYLPAAARQPQGGGGEGEPHRRATLVAHPGRRGVPGPSPGRPGPVLRAGRRRPPAAPGGRDRDHGGRAGRRRGAAPDAHRAVPGRSVRRRAGSARRPWSRSAATPTPSARGWPATTVTVAHRLGHRHPRHRLPGRGGAGPAPPPTRLAPAR